MTGKKTPSDYQKEASKATAKFRAANPGIPKTTQIHHANKVLAAKDAVMSFKDMNENLIPLQSSKHLPATKLHISPKGNFTKYTVHKEVRQVNAPKPANAKDVNSDLSNAIESLNTEHKFVDKFLTEKAYSDIKNANPNADPKHVVKAGGAVALWKLTGDPGKVPSNIAQKIDIGKGERLPSNLGNPSKSAPRLSNATAGGAPSTRAKPARGSGSPSGDVKASPTNAKISSASLRVSQHGPAGSSSKPGPAQNSRTAPPGGPKSSTAQKISPSSLRVSATSKAAGVTSPRAAPPAAGKSVPAPSSVANGVQRTGPRGLGGGGPGSGFG
jgi:hypothetical protein